MGREGVENWLYWRFGIVIFFQTDSVKLVFKTIIVRIANTSESDLWQQQQQKKTVIPIQG